MRQYFISIYWLQQVLSVVFLTELIFKLLHNNLPENKLMSSHSVSA